MLISQFRWGLWAALALVILAAPVALSFELIANSVSYVFAIAAFLLAVWRPRVTIFGAGLLIAAWIIIAPFAMMAAVPWGEAWRDSIAFSWEWRWETWSYARELIAEKPIFGWGVDAARTFKEQVSLRGFELDRMPLHTHSAALQIWLELGLIGAVLAAGLIISFADRLARKVNRAQAAAIASGVAAFGVPAFVSYGVWQEWWWATAAMMAIVCVLTGPGKQQS